MYVFWSFPLLVMQASHCPEIDTRWACEYGIFNFTLRWPRNWSTDNHQPKQVWFAQVKRLHLINTQLLPKVMRLHQIHKDANFYQVVYLQDMWWVHDVILWVQCVPTWSQRCHWHRCWNHQSWHQSKETYCWDLLRPHRQWRRSPCSFCTWKNR